MPLNIDQIFRCLRDFDFATLLVRELHWSLPVFRKIVPIDYKHSRHEIARYAGVPVFEITATDGTIPNLKTRDALRKEISSLFPKSLLIFIDEHRTQSVWHWVKRERTGVYRREYVYAKGQPEDLLLNKLNTIVTDIVSADENRMGKGASDTRSRPLTSKIYKEFTAQHRQLSEYIDGIHKEQDRDLYASILLNRLIFLYFLQRRGFIDNGNKNYLEDALRNSRKDCYYRAFLLPLFFEGLSKPQQHRTEDVQALLGKVIYLGGSLFQPHAIELQNADIQIPDPAFENLFSFFSRYKWQIVDVPSGERENEEITPEILGHIFEMHFNQVSGIGLSYTPPEILEYLCRQTIHQVILEKVRPQALHTRQTSPGSLEEMLAKLDAQLCRRLLLEVMPSLTVLDPACGSGAFLVTAFNALVTIYSEVLSKIASLNDDVLSRWLDDLHHNHRSVLYYLKKNIIATNLYGVDIREDAIEIARLRLYLSLIVSAQSADELEPLSDIGFHLSAGNSLIGLLRANETEDLPPTEVKEKNRAKKMAQLNRALLAQLHQSKRRYQPSRSDITRESDEQGAGRRLNIEDIEKLVPLHWGYEFPHIMNQQGGFDVVLTNPPWEALKSSSGPASEIAYYQRIALQLSSQYQYQNTVVNGKTRRADVNLYKLFVERSYNLLRNEGYCGMVVPHGICADAGTQQLRELLFNKTGITGLFSFENSKKIFEGLDRRVKFDLLTFEKGKPIEVFPAAFARQNVEELDRFPIEGAVNLTTDFIRRFSPDVLAIAEFRNQRDIRICQKMLRFPLLGEKLADTWNVEFAPGISVSSLDHLELAGSVPDTLPLYEGKMIQQFTHIFSTQRYSINKQSNARFLQQLEKQQPAGYRGYRLGVRDVAASKDERTVIATILPPNVLISNTINFTSSPLDADALLFLTAIFNSFVADFILRFHASLHIAIHAIYQLPVPRLTRQDEGFISIVEGAARLVCTTQEFKELWEAAIAEPWSPEIAATMQVERNRLRAELDGLIAHLYNVTEEEFTYILRTFPLVADPIKIAAQNAYRDVERGLIV